LPHVLNQCKGYFTAVAGCHKAVLDQLVTTIVPQIGTNVRVNQTVPGLIEGLWPDLVFSGWRRPQQSLMWPCPLRITMPQSRL
jgi:hypothetical protein